MQDIKNAHSVAIPSSVLLGKLKRDLQQILTSFDSGARIIYYDYPLHLNVGDLLINLGTEQFFHENKLNIWRRYSLFDIPENISGMDEKVVILAHGGGNFGDIYPNYQSGRERLLKKYPRNRIVVLPQTVHFSSPERAADSLSVFRKHENSHIFVRDQRSLAILQNAGLPSVSAMPDMAHALWEVIQPSAVPTESSPLRFARTDGEAANSGIQVSQSTVDWADILRPSTDRIAKIGLKLVSLQNKLHLHSDKTRLWYPLRDRAIRDGVAHFSLYESIHTNRLHAMILGILLGRRVYACDNSYGKLSSYAGAWLNGLDLIEFV